MAMRALGAALGAVLLDAVGAAVMDAAAGPVVLLKGPLGAGKTTLAQGIGEGLGVADAVVSPSFTLVREYEVPGADLRFVHADFYRLHGEAEVAAIGLSEYIDQGDIVVVEWPERAGDYFAADALLVEIEYAEPGRRTMHLSAGGTDAKLLLDALMNRLPHEAGVREVEA